jgi:hypothetical protein
MRCDELRQRAAGGLWVLGTDADAEEHLAGCEACFDWLEQRDPLVGAVRAARPPDVQPSPALAREVVTAWRATALLPVPGRAMLGLAAAAMAAGAGAVLIVVVSVALGGRLDEVIGLLAGWVGSLLVPASAVGGFAAGQLLDHPAWIMGLGAVAAVAAWGWTRIDLGITASMRETA